MTTYTMTYQPEGLEVSTHTIKWCDTPEQAAWIAKNYCTKFNFKLIDVEPNEA